MAAFSRGKPRLFSGTCLAQPGVPAIGSTANPNAHLVCLADWLGNRTLRNFLLRYSEPLWADVTRSLCLLGVLCLRHLAPSLDSVWGSEDLATLVDYIQREERWPEELTPAPLHSNKPWEPPWRQHHCGQPGGPFLKPSPEWRMAGAAEAGRSGRRAMSAAHARSPPGPFGVRSAEHHRDSRCTRAASRASSADAKNSRSSAGRAISKSSNADKARENSDCKIMEGRAPAFNVDDLVKEPATPRQVSVGSNSETSQTQACSDSQGRQTAQSSRDRRRAPAQIADEFLRSSLGAVFCSAQPTTDAVIRAPDTNEWRDAEERHCLETDMLLSKPNIACIRANTSPLGGCSELRDPRLARGGWAAEVPIRTSKSELVDTYYAEGEEVWTETASELGEPTAQLARDNVADRKDSPFRAARSSAPTSVSSTPSSVLGLGSAWSCSGGPLARTYA